MCCVLMVKFTCTDKSKAELRERLFTPGRKIVNSVFNFSSPFSFLSSPFKVYIFPVVAFSEMNSLCFIGISNVTRSKCGL